MLIYYTFTLLTLMYTVRMKEEGWNYKC